MAEMLDAKDAKARLGCDDATLTNYINSGALRAQRVGGKLLVNEEDVDKLVKDDEGTIVLTGDSENLSIDLGKVVDDSSATIVSSNAGQGKKTDDSITFGDELEVVSFDDGNTKPLSFDDDAAKAPATQTTTKATAQAAGLNFTDSNTAVITSVDETQVGATTGVMETGVQQDLDRANAPLASESSRRSVRSTRVAAAEVPAVHWAWIVVMILTLIIGLTLIAPYYPISMWPSSAEKDAAQNTKRGLADGIYAKFAGGSLFAGFSVEPNKDVFLRGNAGSEWRDIKGGHYQENQAEWRYLKWLRPDGAAEKMTVERRADMATIRKISSDGKTATAIDDLKSYPVVERTVRSGNADTVRREPDLGLDAR
ncbi:MAG: hypothetical protein RLZZ127_2212 [Planctomycetota bacterium]|jgi:hypothetical protein